MLAMTSIPHAALALALVASAMACGGNLDVGSNQGAPASGPAASSDGGAADASATTTPTGSSRTDAGPCKALGDVPEVLVQGGQGVVANGQSLFVVEANEGVGAELFRAAIDGVNARDSLAQRKHPEGIAAVSADFAHVAYAVSVIVPNPESFTTELREVVAIDLATRAAVTVPRPNAGTTTIGEVLAHDGAVYFSAYEPGGAGSVFRWDGANTRAIVTIGYRDPWFIEGASIYVHEEGAPSPGAHASAIKKSPLAGGAAVTLKAFAAPPGSARPGVIGVREGRVYFRPIEGGIASVSVDGGDERVHVASPTPAATVAYVGREHFFSFEQGGSVIQRRAKAGGVAEVFVEETLASGIHALTLDACNVYWRTGFEPSVIKGKRQAP